MPSASHASLMPSTTSENCHITSGCSGLPKLRQFTSAMRPGAGARDVARGFEHHEPRRRCADRADRNAPCRRSTARAPSACPSRATPRRRRPGPATVFRNSWWSYWRDTHVLSAIVGVASSASSSPREVGARGELVAQLRARDRRPATRPARRAARPDGDTAGRRPGSRPARRRSAARRRRPARVVADRRRGVLAGHADRVEQAVVDAKARRCR